MTDMKLTQRDYKDILDYYKIKYNNLTPSAIKAAAENMLATKLCRCIKKVQGTSANATSANATTSSASGYAKEKERKAIAICTASVIKRKHLKTYKFTCKKQSRLLPKKGTRTPLRKTKKILLK
jgi:hypothetical protein